MPDRCVHNSHSHVGASEAKRSEAVVWGLLGVSVFFTHSACLVLLCGLLLQAPPNVSYRCSPNSHSCGSERSEAERGHGLGLVGLFFLINFSLLLMFSLAVILVCVLLLKAIPSAPRCVRDALQILIHVGASEAKRSEAVVWGLLGSFF